MESTKEDYRKKMEAQLAEWSARIDVLKAKVAQTAAETKTELHEELEKLRAVETTGKKHLADVEIAAAETWGEVKVEIEKKWNQLHGTVEAIRAKLS